MSEIKEAVHDYYASKARRLAVVQSSCCTPCCEPEGLPAAGDYAPHELQEAGLDATASLGCGNPILLADLQAGERVLDLGSGGGLDAFLAAGRVGPDGHVYGLDMTDEMLELAQANRDRLGLRNVTFLKGAIEKVPLPSRSVDVVISNCVINLAEDKGSVLKEAFRVLRPGGRLAISDVVELKDLPQAVRESSEAWACCIGGAISTGTYRDLLEQAGFESIAIETTRPEEVEGVAAAIASGQIRARRPPE